MVRVATTADHLPSTTRPHPCRPSRHMLCFWPTAHKQLGRRGRARARPLASPIQGRQGPSVPRVADVVELRLQVEPLVPLHDDLLLAVLQQNLQTLHHSLESWRGLRQETKALQDKDPTTFAHTYVHLLCWRYEPPPPPLSKTTSSSAIRASMAAAVFPPTRVFLRFLRDPGL